MKPQLRPVSGTRDLKRFIHLPFELYADDPHWVPPLIASERKRFDRKRHPFFRHGDLRLFLAMEGRHAVGRIAAIEHRAHNERHGERTGFWGFFEAQRDHRTVASLFAAAAEELAGRGLTVMRGPFNPTVNDSCGLLVDGFERPPALMMPYNPAWYPALVEAAGQRPMKELLAYDLLDQDDDSKKAARMHRLAQRVRRRLPGLRLRHLDMRRFDQDGLALNALFNEAREGNWGFVPVTEAEFAAEAAALKAVLDPRLVVMAELDGELIGCVMGVPDVGPLLRRCRGRMLPTGWWHWFRGRRGIDRARVFGAATKRAYRNLGITPVLFARLVESGTAAGFPSAELGWVAADNHASRATIEHAFRLSPSKRYAIYESAL